MKAVILTAPGLEHRYVANALANALGPRLAGIVVESAANDSFARSLSKAVKRYGYARVLERVATKAVRKMLRHGTRQATAHRRVLGSDREQWPPAVPVVRTGSVNDGRTADFLREVEPTHLFVYGTGIVRDRVLSMAPRALNMHTGLSPYYRGSDTEFWPLYVGEPHMVGITVHECTAALDGGAIYARASVPLEPGDDAFLAFARCVKLGADVYASVAMHLAQDVPATALPQDLQTGRLYRFTDRTFVQELAMEIRVRSGTVRRAIQRTGSSDLPFPKPEFGW